MDELFIVPVHVCAGGTVVLRTGHLGPDGERVGIAFTSQERLGSALGERQQWIRLSGRALHAMLRPLGIAGVQVDPLFAGPEARVTAAPAAPRQFRGEPNARDQRRHDSGARPLAGHGPSARRR